MGVRKAILPARTLIFMGRRRFGTSFRYGRHAGAGNEVKLPLFAPFLEASSSNKIAFTDYTGQNFTFGELGDKSMLLAKELKSLVSGEGERISFILDKDSSFPITLGATWWSQNVAIPLSPSHPENVLEYFLQSTGSRLIVTTGKYAERINRIAKVVDAQLLVVDFDKLKSDDDHSHNSKSALLDPSRYEEKGALILFTSGTTRKPKGVLLTHSNILAQVETIGNAFEIGEGDTLLHVLPLHHTHGLIHALITTLHHCARCHMLEKFDAAVTWNTLLSSNEMRPNILMGVPTVYVKLIEEFNKSFLKKGPKSSLVREISQEKMRLFLSGSASLPVPILERFENITGHVILERYGMTEIGVALTNPLHGVRRPGFVGAPFGTVKAMVANLKSSSEYEVLAKGDGKKFEVNVKPGDSVVGDLLIKGPSVFKEYWCNPAATRKEFTEDGWFITGDTVEYVKGEGGDPGSLKILGRKSVDIIKSGGYKLSALEIETQLLSLSEVREVAVLGLPDPTWGQRVAAIVVWNGKELDAAELGQIAKSRLAKYAIPTVLKSMSELPKNPLGKVNKKELAKMFS